MSLRILFAGSGEFGLPALAALVDAGHEVVQVYTQPDRPAGRGRQLTPTPIAGACLQRGLPLVRTASLNTESLPPADLLVVIAFGQKISEAVTRHPRRGSVNLHASILPKYRGAAPINWAILRGETITGNSIIRLAQRMDAGDVLAQSRLTIGDTETAGELHDRLAADGAPLMLRVVHQLSDGTAIEQVQDESLASAAPKLSREAAVLDWSKPAASLARQINGLSPWPGCRVRVLDGEQEITQLTLVRAAVADGTTTRPTGTLAGSDTVSTGDGLLRLLQVQPQGKRPMSPADFARGNRWAAGFRLVSL